MGKWGRRHVREYKWRTVGGAEGGKVGGGVEKRRSGGDERTSAGGLARGGSGAEGGEGRPPSGRSRPPGTRTPLRGTPRSHSQICIRSILVWLTVAKLGATPTLRDSRPRAPGLDVLMQLARLSNTSRASMWSSRAPYSQIHVRLCDRQRTASDPNKGLEATVPPTATPARGSPRLPKKRSSPRYPIVRHLGFRITPSVIYLLDKSVAFCIILDTAGRCSLSLPAFAMFYAVVAPAAFPSHLHRSFPSLQLVPAHWFLHLCVLSVLLYVR